METKMGVWIDHRKAVIVDLGAQGPETRTVLSGVENSFAGQAIHRLRAATKRSRSRPMTAVRLP